MSDRQLMKMLQLEGIFYTVGTLIISIGVGSLAGYPLFLYAKRTGMFDIQHIPLSGNSSYYYNFNIVCDTDVIGNIHCKSVRKIH